MIKKSQPVDTLEERQERFLSLWKQWEKFIYKKLTEKGFPAHSEESTAACKQFQGYMWALFDRFDSRKAQFSTWMLWQFKAWWRDRAYSLKLGFGPDSEPLRTARRPDPRAPRTEEGKKRVLQAGLVPRGLRPDVLEPSRPGDRSRGEVVDPSTLVIPDPVAEMYLRTVISTLSEKDQQLVDLLELGHTHEEIALVVGLTRQAVSDRVKTLRIRMKRAIDSRVSNDAQPRLAYASLTYWREYFKGSPSGCPSHIMRVLYPEL